MRKLEDTYEIVDELFDSEGYDWSIVAILRRKTDGALFWDADYGCSCNGPWERGPCDPTPFTWFSLGDVRETAMTMSSGTDTDVHEWIARQAKLLPKATS